MKQPVVMSRVVAKDLRVGDEILFDNRIEEVVDITGFTGWNGKFVRVQFGSGRSISFREDDLLVAMDNAYDGKIEYYDGKIECART